ncbi:MAG: HD domain-containing protein [Bacteriovoracaceae bacterium]|nr:HD domain-containing protein [Bacteriovoracaceae bacterium]
MKYEDEMFSKLLELSSSLSFSKNGGTEEELYYLRSKMKRYEALISLGKLVSSSMDFKNVQKKAISKIRELMGCEHIIFYRLDPITSTLVGRRNEHSEKVSLPVDENTFAGASAHYNAVLHIHDVRSDIRYGRELRYFSDITYHNMILAPLVSKGEVLGVIQAINSKSPDGDFDNDDLYFIEAIATKLTALLESFSLFDKLQSQFFQVCQAMGDVTLKRDRYTGGHTKRVAYFSEMIGKEMDMSPAELKEIKLSSILHDIGKISIEDSILKKQGHLTNDEFAVMKNHPHTGYEIIGHIEALKKVGDGVRYHHERPDGKGYPYGLKGDEIPLIAQIISVADTFDAMISNRPYRKGLDPMIAYKEIIDNAGTQFSQIVVNAFESAFTKSVMFKRLRPKLSNVA